MLPLLLAVIVVVVFSFVTVVVRVSSATVGKTGTGYVGQWRRFKYADVKAS